MSVIFWDNKGVFHQNIYEKCDSDGPWFYSICGIRIVNEAIVVDHFEKEPIWTMVVRVGETHYVISEDRYQSRDNVHDECWLKQACLGILVNPEYPIVDGDEPNGNGLYLQITTTITGTFLPKHWITARDILNAIVDEDGEAKERPVSHLSYKREHPNPSNPYCFEIHPWSLVGAIRFHWRNGSLHEFQSWRKLKSPEPTGGRWLNVLVPVIDPNPIKDEK